MAQDTLAEPTSAVAEKVRGPWSWRTWATRWTRWTQWTRQRRWFRPAVAVCAGLLLVAAFPPLGWWPLAPVAVALFTLAVRERPWRRAAATGLVFGLAFCFPLFEGLRPVGLDAWVALSVFEALYFGLLGAGLALVTRLPGWPVWTAAVWVGQEFVRGRVPFGGFPWGRLAFSQTDSMLTGYAALGGAPLVGFVTALIGGALAAAAVWRRLTVVTAAVAGIAVLGLAGFLVPRPTGGPAVTVAVIQGNVPRAGLDFLGQRAAVLDNHARATHQLAARIRAGQVPRPDLVIWPENSSDLDPYADDTARAVIDAAVRDVGVPVLVGAAVDTGDGEHAENRGIVWSPASGPGAYYVKRHPLPFGEYIPIFRGVLRTVITRFDRVAEFVKGHSPGLLRMGPVRIGDVICFEVAYDGIVRDVAGAPLLVVQTNNATFGRTSLPPQQFAMSRLRAVEHGRTTLVASTSGISGIIAPNGKVLEQSAEFRPDIEVQRVPLRTARTIADRVGGTPEWVLAALGLAAAVTAAWRSRSA